MERAKPSTSALARLCESYFHHFSGIYSFIYYKLSNYYYPQYEDGILWNDKYLKFRWPTKKPIVSKKDRKLKNLSYIHLVENGTHMSFEELQTESRSYRVQMRVRENVLYRASLPRNARV